MQKRKEKLIIQRPQHLQIIMNIEEEKISSAKERIKPAQEYRSRFCSTVLNFLKS